MRHDYSLAAAALAAFWTLCALIHPTIRRATIGGTRCLSRYPDLWRIPMFFGLGYAVFQLAAAMFLQWRIGENLTAWTMDVTLRPAPDVPSLALGSLLPAAERTASVFTIFTATFPLSALCALLLLCNFRGMFGELAKAILKRLGRGKGSLVLVLLAVAALSGIAKPAAYLFLPEIAGAVPISAVLAVNFLSVIFEFLLGIFFLTYLMLMAYAWMRGLHFQRARLFHVAAHRIGFVLKWSLLLAGLTASFVLLPLYAGIFLGGGGDFYESCAWFSNWIGRPAVTLFALIYCPVQAILVFHNESLREALRDATGLLRARWLTILLFLAAVFTAFFLLEAVSNYSSLRLGMETAAALGARIIVAWIEALLAGWFIATWVCLYKNLSAGRKEIPF